MLKLNHLTGFGSGVAGAAGDVTSYVFDGTGDYLSIPDHADFNFTGGDWTIEFWRYETTVTNDVVYYSQFESSSDEIKISNKGGGNKGIQLRLEISSAVTAITSNNSVLSDNTWHHIAFSWNSGTGYVFVDGVDQTSTESITTWSDFAADIHIGVHNGASYMNGLIDELRVSDTARYTAGFTPSTTQFESDANTLLLIHGGEAYTGALTGETTQAVYSFDGTGDYLTVPDHADWFFSGDFTIDFWMYVNSWTSNDALYGHNSGGSNPKHAMWLVTGNDIRWLVRTADLASDITSSSSFSTGGWHHVAAERNGNVFTLYLDGVDVGNATDAGTYEDQTSSFYIGYDNQNGDLNGKIAEFRISDTARYTSGFTPATERHTSDANTLLLIHGDEYFTGNWASGITGSGATFTDSGNTGHTVTEVGNAFSGNGGTFTDSGNTGHTVIENGQAKRTTEAEYKFATDGVGYYFDGTGDYLSHPDHADWAFGDGDFTIEFWAMSLLGERNDEFFIHNTDGSNKIWIINGDNGGIKFRVQSGGSIIVDVTQGTRSTRRGVWFHCACVRNGNEWDVYINGVSVANTTDADSVPDFTGSVRWAEGTTANPLNGYMDEMRISDVARYTTDFTPSSTQFSSDANTLLLIHGGEAKSGTTGSGATFTDSGDTGHTVTENGNAIESTGNLYKF
jgi:hypothetical protein